MKQYFRKKAVTAAAFTGVLFFGMVNNLKVTWPLAQQEIAIKSEDFFSGDLIDKTEELINEHAYGKYACIENYGMLQVFLNKNEENNFEVIKDNDGALYYSYFSDGNKDMSGLAESMTEYAASIRDTDTHVVYAMTPDKMLSGITTFESGLPYHYANEDADEFLKLLDGAGVDTLDYRESILDSGIAAKDLFFQTDHHWTINTAFWAYQQLVSFMEERYGYVLDPEGIYTNIENYNQITYQDSFIGSMARKTGIYYGGVDDFTLIYPKFKTDFSFFFKNYDYEFSTEGRFEYSLLNMGPWNYEGNPYDKENDKYETYLYGNLGFVRITNQQNTDGPKVLIVKDSYMVPVAAFLANVCSEVFVVDPRYYEGSITELTKSIEDLSVVVVSFTPQNLTEEFINFE